MTKGFLKVLNGGQSLDIRTSNRHFISAYVTDTRLMGVLAVYAHWHLDNLPEDDEDRGNTVWGDLHQFFYIDCEEAGIETYHEVRSSDMNKVYSIEQLIMGGLGADKVDLDEDQLISLLSQWKDFNEDHGLPLPEDRSHYDFIFSDISKQDKGQSLHRRNELMDLICPTIRTDLQLINYFLMRCFGNDMEGASYLTADDVQVAIDTFDSYRRTTFCRNAIDDKSHMADGSKEYLCESIVETDGRYDRIISQVTVKDLKVRELICRSISHLSHREAAMLMKKSEFVDLYDVMLSEGELENNIDEFTLNFHTTVSEYENGRLFLSYRPNNDHVNRRVFQINEDVRGMLFLSDHGQLLVAAYNEGDMMSLNAALKSNVLSPYLALAGRYEFKTPVIYEFMHSDIDYFQTFLEIIGSGKDRN